MIFNGYDVRACGTLIYNSINELLLSSCDRGFEDFGGLIDKNDYECAYRETLEETNFVLNKFSLKKNILKTKPIYIPHSKYLVFIISLSKLNENFKSKNFGKFELHDNIKRIVKFVPFSIFLNPIFIKTKLLYRLRHKNFFDKIKSL